MIDTLKELCLINGISGREDKVREFIISRINGKCEWSVDPIGNILAFKKGSKTPENKVMISAHMDEVGFIVTYICDNGFIKFSPVGGVDKKVVAGRHVIVGDNNIHGIIGNKAMHLCDGDESTNVPDTDKMYIDIGSTSKQETEKYVSIGDSVYFDSDFVRFGNGKIKAKAIDDRFGCATMIKMIESELEYDAHFAFLVQEEVGCRGAGPAVYNTRPNYAIVLEATTAADVAGVSEQNSVCVQGKGAVVSFMDRSTVYDKTLFRSAFEIAAKNNINIQPKTLVAGGNDAGTIHRSCGGVKTIAISLPCRYIHSASSVGQIDDMYACYDLANALLKEYANDCKG